MSFYFTKMHGLGNDFMVIDGINQSIDLDKKTIAALANRNTGVGFDQCLLIEKSIDGDADFFYRIFNADGQEVGQCGNGARCLMRFVHRYKLSAKKEITVATKTTRMHLRLNEDETVSVDFGLPDFRPSHIPLAVENEAILYYLPLVDGKGQTEQTEQKEQAVHAVSVGNPHAVMLVEDVQNLVLDKLGKAISKHPLFPEECNAGFMEIKNENTIALRVFERGVGETSACGSAAVAAVAIGRKFHHLAHAVSVILPGGMLRVEWPDMQQSITLTGDATFVYEGKLCASLS
jgi:diaminopimelate epimerase